MKGNCGGVKSGESAWREPGRTPCGVDRGELLLDDDGWRTPRLSRTNVPLPLADEGTRN